jgi:multidrug efflux system outer membrane protein
MEARALAGIAKSFLYPEIGAGFGTSQEQQSRVGDPKLTKEQVPDRTYSNWALSGTLSWEIDLFGKIRRGREAAVAQYLATEEGRKALMVTLGRYLVDLLYLRELDPPRDRKAKSAERRDRHYYRTGSRRHLNRLEMDQPGQQGRDGRRFASNGEIVMPRTR